MKYLSLIRRHQQKEHSSKDAILPYKCGYSGILGVIKFFHCVVYFVSISRLKTYIKYQHKILELNLRFCEICATEGWKTGWCLRQHTLTSSIEMARLCKILEKCLKMIPASGDIWRVHTVSNTPVTSTIRTSLPHRVATTSSRRS